MGANQITRIFSDFKMDVKINQSIKWSVSGLSG